MIKIAHGLPGEEILTRADTLKEGIIKVKEFRINELLEDIKESHYRIVEIRDQMDLIGVTDELIYNLESVEDSITESEEMIEEINKCKNYTQLDALEIYDEGWAVSIIH